MTTGRINQVARLKREPARQLQHQPEQAGLRMTQTGNRCSYEREAIHMHASTLRTLCSGMSLTTTRQNTICVSPPATRQTAYRSNDSYKGPPEVCGAKSRRASNRHRIRESRQKSKGLQHSIRPRTNTRISPTFRLPKGQNMSERQANINRGTTSLPTRG